VWLILRVHSFRPYFTVDSFNSYEIKSSGDSSKNTSGDEVPVVPSSSSVTSNVIPAAAPVSSGPPSVAGSPGDLLLPSSPSVPSPDHSSSSGSAHEVLVNPTDRSARSWTWTDSDVFPSSSGSSDYPGSPSDDDSSSVSARSRPPSAVSSHGSFNAEDYVDVPEEQDPERDADDEADDDTDEESDGGSDEEPPMKRARGNI